MLTCPYCANSVNVIDVNNAFCSFCEVELGPNSEYGMYSKEGIRREKVKRIVYLAGETVQLPLKKLYELHPLDLIMCLKEARSERAQVYNLMRMFNKSNEDAVTDPKKLEEYKQLAKETGENYEFWTRKCWTIENLLINRIGYFPERINSEFLAAFTAKNEKSLSKPMTILKGK